jgi:sugar O-acyltransferase (sialic acid O-acetyltransferase NeuD family)
MNRKIAYIGFGALGQQIALLLRQSTTGQMEEVIFDDHAAGEKTPGAYPFGEYMNSKFEDYEFYLCLGYMHLPFKHEIAENLKSARRKLTSFIHSSSIINPSAAIGPGSIVYAGCNIDQFVQLEEGVFLNNSVTVSHNSIIGKHSFLAPGVVISGNVRIGAQCFIGAGTLIGNGITIGDNTVIGIGSVITRDIPPGSSVIGNPMRILDKKLKLT